MQYILIFFLLIAAFQLTVRPGFNPSPTTLCLRTSLTHPPQSIPCTLTLCSHLRPPYSHISCLEPHTHTMVPSHTLHSAFWYPQLSVPQYTILVPNVHLWMFRLTNMIWYYDCWVASISEPSEANDRNSIPDFSILVCIYLRLSVHTLCKAVRRSCKLAHSTGCWVGSFAAVCPSSPQNMSFCCMVCCPIPCHCLSI